MQAGCYKSSLLSRECGVCDALTLFPVGVSPLRWRQAYLYNDDDFNWNYGMSLANVGDFKVRRRAAHPPPFFPPQQLTECV